MALAQRLYEGVELGEDGRRRPHHLHAHRLDPGLGRRPAPGRGPTSPSVLGGDHLPAAARRLTSAEAARAAQGPTRPSGPPRRSGRRSGSRPFLARPASATGPALPAGLEPLRGQPDGAGGATRRPPRGSRPPGGRRRAAVFLAAGATLAEPGWLPRRRGPAALAGGGRAAPRRCRPGCRRLGAGPAARAPAASPRCSDITAPPPRFTEATLVKALEARGLGRPSTFAAIVDTVQARGYVERAEKRLPPPRSAPGHPGAAEALPRAARRGLHRRAGGGARRVEEGRADWQRWWPASTAPLAGGPGAGPAAAARAGPARPPVTCEKCGQPMAVRFGQGRRVPGLHRLPGLPGHPRLPPRGRRPWWSSRPAGPTPASPARSAGRRMVLRRGRFGRFLACSPFPACDGKRPPPSASPAPAAAAATSPSGAPSAAGPSSAAPGGRTATSSPGTGPATSPARTAARTWLVEVVSRRVGPALACPNKGCGYRRRWWPARPEAAPVA